MSHILDSELQTNVNFAFLRQLGEDVRRDLEHVTFMLPETEADDERDTFTNQMMGTQLFELYLSLNEFVKFKQHLPPAYVVYMRVTS